ncbi:MAG: CPBP family intramembrane metalloprotease [Alphaproteobacteria bacterium]|nr:CPBP family intramembrane metalloprotease [Alphaproteobacteria bacterium]
MTDSVLTLAAHLAALIALIALASLFARKPLRLSWAVAAIVVFAVYWAALMYGSKIFTLDAMQPLADLVPSKGWNWRGKIVSILTTLAMTGVVSLMLKDAWTRAGFTLRQAPGSIGPALVATALLVAISCTLEYMAHDGTDTSPARLLFQAVAPGLDEEPFFRGLWLLLLAEAFAADQTRILRFGYAGIVSSLIFGVVHGVAVQDGALQIVPLAILYPGATGLGLLWIRERTGSLLVPILAHNAINVALSFF